MCSVLLSLNGGWNGSKVERGAITPTTHPTRQDTSEMTRRRLANTLCTCYLHLYVLSDTVTGMHLLTES